MLFGKVLYESVDGKLLCIHIARCIRLRSILQGSLSVYSQINVHTFLSLKSRTFSIIYMLLLLLCNTKFVSYGHNIPGIIIISRYILPMRCSTHRVVTIL